jgi:N-acetylglucosaminyldiphosphoundecaprenol N-acetyl-beta-D-mannosaminyltransferase
MKSFKILDVKIDSASFDEIIDETVKAIETRQKIQIATVNNEFVLEAIKNKNFREVLNSSNLSICESTGVCWALKLLYGEPHRKTPGADLFLRLCSLCSQKGYRIFLFGGQSGVARQTAEKLIKMFPRLVVSGFVDGIEIDPSEDNPEVVGKINQSKPDILFVGLGAPKQELWIANNIKKLDAKVFIGIGGTLDYYSGRVQRAPRWMRSANLEWLFRLIMQPKRFLRIARATIVFPVLIINEKMRVERGKKT